MLFLIRLLLLIVKSKIFLDLFDIILPYLFCLQLMKIHLILNKNIYMMIKNFIKYLTF